MEDLGSLTFFANFAGMLSALKNSVLVAALPPLAAIVALMGFLDLPLDAVTVMVGAIVGNLRNNLAR